MKIVVIIVAVISYILGAATSYVIFPIIGVLYVMSSLEFFALSVCFAVLYFFLLLVALSKI